MDAQKERKKATQLASYSCCNLCASTYCALYHPFQLLPFFSLFSALLGYVQSIIPQAALDYRPRVIFFIHLLTSIPTYLSSSCFCTFLSFCENLWYKLVLFCAQKHVPSPEHPGASPISSGLQTSFSSFSFPYLPTYLSSSCFRTFLYRKFFATSLCFLVGWLVHKHVPSVYSQQNMLVDYYFFNFHFCWEILRVFYFIFWNHKQ